MKNSQKHKKAIYLTPSTLKLNQMTAGRHHGMLTLEEIELLRKSKREIADVCKNVRNLCSSELISLYELHNGSIKDIVESNVECTNATFRKLR